MLIEIDIDRLREDLLDYLGTAVLSGFGAAVVDYTEVEQASGEELCRIAEQLGFNLREYAIK